MKGNRNFASLNIGEITFYFFETHAQNFYRIGFNHTGVNQFFGLEYDFDDFHFAYYDYMVQNGQTLLEMAQKCFEFFRITHQSAVWALNKEVNK